jgi:hypothetical protein
MQKHCGGTEDGPVRWLRDVGVAATLLTLGVKDSYSVTSGSLRARVILGWFPDVGAASFAGLETGLGVRIRLLLEQGLSCFPQTSTNDVARITTNGYSIKSLCSFTISNAKVGFGCSVQLKIRNS